jgi:hypothetical protein
MQVYLVLSRIQSDSLEGCPPGVPRIPRSKNAQMIETHRAFIGARRGNLTESPLGSDLKVCLERMLELVELLDETRSRLLGQNRFPEILQGVVDRAELLV